MHPLAVFVSTNLNVAGPVPVEYRAAIESAGLSNVQPASLTDHWYVFAFAIADGEITFPTEPHVGRGAGAVSVHVGAILPSVTDAVAVLVHAVALFVTVTVYVPVELTVGFAVVPPETIPGPAQLNPVPPPAAERTTEVVVHVSVPPVALAPGPTPVKFTEAVAVLEQPVAELPTVTVYVPVALTVGLAVVPPETTPGPAQLNPVPLEVAAERTTDVTEHVNDPPVALAPGEVPVELTNAVAVLVQPLDELVTVTV